MNTYFLILIYLIVKSRKLEEYRRRYLANGPVKSLLALEAVLKSFLNKYRKKTLKKKEHFTVYQSTVQKVALQKGKDGCFLTVSKLATHLIHPIIYKITMSVFTCTV